CSMTYGVKFPMFSKTAVKSEPREPFYSDLIKATGSAPAWNFHKYLIGRDGRSVSAFPSNVAPDSNVLVREIEAALAK
ncbi:glutathione peroxidase, partial [Acinetobacter baumannii]